MAGNEGVFIKWMSYYSKIKLEGLKPNFNSSKVYIIYDLYFSFFDGKVVGTRDIDMESVLNVLVLINISSKISLYLYKILNYDFDILNMWNLKWSSSWLFVFCFTISVLFLCFFSLQSLQHYSEVKPVFI